MTKTLLVPPELGTMAKTVATYQAATPAIILPFEVVVLRAMPPHQFVLVDSAEIEKHLFQVSDYYARSDTASN